ncbi:MAG: glycosyltransferase [Actinomycetota bacterium]|nr:glycosyltransferase [Actinomycetota bacterium]
MASTAGPAPLVLCSKSAWEPAVRREHAWATIAAELGHPVAFLAAPLDVRELRRGRGRDWLGGLGGGSRRAVASSLVVRQRSTFVPGHRYALARFVDSQLLRLSLARSVATLSDASVVCCWPWDWPAVAASTTRRRVFDMSDDWGELMPGRRARFAKLYRRIAAEADEVIVVNPALASRFPGREPVLIRNGVTEAMIDAPSAPAAERTLVYVGTLTPRFDAPLVRRVLELLPDWQLELVGACMYPGLGDRPAPELRDLLDLGASRVRWHGPLPREEMVGVLDRGAVAIAPNRSEHSLGQDSMKLYDYAARGRPIVSTPWRDALAADGPPHLSLGETPDELCAAIAAAAAEPAAFAAERRRWAAEHTWSARWPAWSAAVFGDRA